MKNMLMLKGGMISDETIYNYVVSVTILILVRVTSYVVKYRENIIKINQ